jgi:hypothetical protein
MAAKSALRRSIARLIGAVQSRAELRFAELLAARLWDRTETRIGKRYTSGSGICGTRPAQSLEKGIFLRTEPCCLIASSPSDEQDPLQSLIAEILEAENRGQSVDRDTMLGEYLVTINFL